MRPRFSIALDCGGVCPRKQPAMSRCPVRYVKNYGSAAMIETISRGDFFMYPGSWNNVIYGLCDSVIDNKTIYAYCWSFLCPTGEDGPVAVSNIDKIISEETFYREVASLISNRLSLSRAEDEIEKVKSKINSFSDGP